MKIYDEEETVIRRRAGVAEADEETIADDATVAATLSEPGVAP